MPPRNVWPLISKASSLGSQTNRLRCYELTKLRRLVKVIWVLRIRCEARISRFGLATCRVVARTCKTRLGVRSCSKRYEQMGQRVNESQLNANMAYQQANANNLAPRSRGYGKDWLREHSG